MFTAFNQLSAHSRIWIYQADRKLPDQETKDVGVTIQAFCEQWQAHGEPLQTSYRIELNQFLILSVDEGFNNASGCSIDGSVRILKDFQARGINFLDPSKIAFMIGDNVILHSRTDLKAQFSSGTLSNSTLTFNNLVSTKGDLENNWRIPVEKSWMAKYLHPAPSQQFH